MIIALRITMEGKKVVLGFIQAATENAWVPRDFLFGLLNRRLGIENVVNYPALGRRRDSFRKALQRAYEKPSYEEARNSLTEIKKELSLLNKSAVNGLEEGLEETLTLHRLGLFEELGKSLKTTDCLESLMALIGEKTRRVDYWRNSNQKQRWLATALLDIEPRLNRIKGYWYLPVLREALKRELRIKEVSFERKEIVAV